MDLTEVWGLTRTVTHTDTLLFKKHKNVAHPLGIFCGSKDTHPLGIFSGNSWLPPSLLHPCRQGRDVSLFPTHPAKDLLFKDSSKTLTRWPLCLLVLLLLYSGQTAKFLGSPSAPAFRSFPRRTSGCLAVIHQQASQLGSWTAARDALASVQSNDVQGNLWDLEAMEVRTECSDYSTKTPTR